MFRLDVRIVVSGTEYLIPDSDALKRVHSILQGWQEFIGEEISEERLAMIKRRISDVLAKGGE